VAVFRVGEGLGYSMFVRIVLAMVAVLPLANLIMLFVLYVRSKRALGVASDR